MCVCVVIPFILGVRFVDVPAGVTQEEGHTDFSTFLWCLAFFSREKDSAVPSLVDREVEFCLLTN